MIRCDAPDFSRCPERAKLPAHLRPPECEFWDAFQAMANRELGVDDWTPDTDPRAEALYVRARETAPRCRRGTS